MVDWSPGRSKRRPGRRVPGLLRQQRRPAAEFEVVEQTADQIVWRCVDGPQEWRETRIRFQPRPSSAGGTTLLFSHEGWRQESEFMYGCSTNWAAYR
jgi:hypothetical protein